MGLRVSGNYSTLPFGVKTTVDYVNDECGYVMIKIDLQNQTAEGLIFAGVCSLLTPALN